MLKYINRQLANGLRAMADMSETLAQELDEISDGSALEIAISYSAADNVVQIHFAGGPVSWISLTRADAARLSYSILEKCGYNADKAFRRQD